MNDINFVDEITQEEGKLGLHVRKFFLFPEYWEKTENQIPISLEWSNVRFCRKNIDLVPEKKGIYGFVVKPQISNFFETRYLFYIGETTRTLKVRFMEYFDEQQKKGKFRYKVYKMLNLYKDCIYFYYSEIDNDETIKLCEEKLLNTLVPQVNTVIPKAKIKPELRSIYE